MGKVAQTNPCPIAEKITLILKCFFGTALPCGRQEFEGHYVWASCSVKISAISLVSEAFDGMVRMVHQLAETLGGGGLGRLKSGIGFTEKNNVVQKITGIKFAMFCKRNTAIQSAESISAPD